MSSISQRQMYLLLIRRAALARGLRVATALAAVILAATVTTALGNLQAGLQEHFQDQLAAFGPNILVTVQQPPDSQQTARLRELAHGIVALYGEYRGVAYQDNRRLLVPIRAINPESQRSLSGWWRVQGRWMNDTNEAMVGANLARTLHAQPGARISLQLLAGDGAPLDSPASVPGSGARQLPGGEKQDSGVNKAYDGETLQIAGIVSTGGDEDNAILIPLMGTAGAAARSAGVEIRAAGDQAQVEAAAESIQQFFPDSAVHVLQRVARADTLILARLGAVFGLLGLVVVLGASLCVSTTFSTMVYQRSQEIGLQKALGATDSEVVSLFWGEALILGALGTFIGYILGLGFAALIGQSVFQAVIGPRLQVIPLVVVLTIGATLLAALPAARRIARLEPVISLKGSSSEFVS